MKLLKCEEKLSTLKPFVETFRSNAHVGSISMEKSISQILIYSGLRSYAISGAHAPHHMHAAHLGGNAYAAVTAEPTEAINAEPRNTEGKFRLKQLYTPDTRFMNSDTHKIWEKPIRFQLTVSDLREK